jgi:CheY-like chemotaxis protein
MLRCRSDLRVPCRVRREDLPLDSHTPHEAARDGAGSLRRKEHHETPLHSHRRSRSRCPERRCGVHTADVRGLAGRRCTQRTVARGRLRKRPSDLVLVSYDLPGINGLDMAQFVHRSSPHTRIALMTDGASPIGLCEEPLPPLLRGLGQKPVGIGQLWGIVQASL